MPAEEMGKLSERLRLTFAVSTVVCVLVLAISPLKDFRAEWKHYKRSFVKFAQGRPDTKKLLADYSPNIDQVWLPGMNVTDRCTTCHQGITQSSLADASVPQPFRAHPADSAQCARLGLHGLSSWPRARRRKWPKRTKPRLPGNKPILPAHFLQASCGSCHQADLKETPQLSRGRELLTHLNCQACHKLNNLDRPTARAGSFQRRL